MCELVVAPETVVEELLRRKSEYVVMLECVNDEVILNKAILCVIENGMSRSPNTIASKIYVLARCSILKPERLGKYAIVTKVAGKGR